MMGRIYSSQAPVTQQVNATTVRPQGSNALCVIDGTARLNCNRITTVTVPVIG